MISLIFMMLAAVALAGFVLAARDKDNGIVSLLAAVFGCLAVGPYFLTVAAQSEKVFSLEPILPSGWVALVMSIGLWQLMRPLVYAKPVEPVQEGR